ncbi:MAG: hypothetical protein KIH08_07455 [Candidatus Freyarchaeota archaeon]|nr:hypothetical protein [Candidatus Jordarchaeia archaeon]MBS7269638.1 hypothetical protein [Candidatus Jordarchaeia archaeon]MBS7280413.1 hypothetical protein [Candidatus Jordarchaeia archaeon]
MTKNKVWEREWKYTYNNLSVDFEALQKQLKSYLEKRSFKIRTMTPPSDSGFTIMAEKTSKLKISKQPQLAVEVTGDPDSFECTVLANQGKELSMEASKWNLKVTETVEQLKNTKKPRNQEKNTPISQGAKTIVAPTRQEKVIPTTLKKPLLLKKGYYQKLSEILLQIIESQEDEEAVILRTLQAHLREKAPNVEATTKDIEKALQNLKREGLILEIGTLPGGLKIVELTPLELTEELTTILELTQGQKYTTIEEIATKTGWPLAKVEQALKRLEQLGITRKVEGYKTGARWYFP